MRKRQANCIVHLCKITFKGPKHRSVMGDKRVMASLKAKPGKLERKSALCCYSHIYNYMVSLKKLMPTLTGVSHSKITKSQVYCPVILGQNCNIVSILQSLNKFTLNSQRNESHLVCVMVVNDSLGSGCKQLC